LIIRVRHSLGRFRRNVVAALLDHVLQRRLGAKANRFDAWVRFRHIDRAAPVHDLRGRRDEQICQADWRPGDNQTERRVIDDVQSAGDRSQLGFRDCWK
jgi:hypothetical protein